jgi:putative NIF3 family GTP cyclohydrolase 1 type 2
MAAMLSRDVDVWSPDALSGEAVSAISRAGNWTWQPVDAVVFVGSSGQGRLTETCCPVINFFTTGDHARDYQRTHELDGVVLTLSDAIQAATLIFGNLLDHLTRPDPT